MTNFEARLQQIGSRCADLEAWLASGTLNTSSLAPANPPRNGEVPRRGGGVPPLGWHSVGGEVGPLRHSLRERHLPVPGRILSQIHPIAASRLA